MNLDEWEEKSKAMIHWQEKAKDNPDDGPYPSMLKLIQALRKAEEGLKFYWDSPAGTCEDTGEKARETLAEIEWILNGNPE